MALGLAGLTWPLACGVSAQDGASRGLGGERGFGGDPDGNCPLGIAVVLSDFASTQVAVVGEDGRTLVSSLVSSASAPSDGLAFAISGDVALPTNPNARHELVLLDRYGTNVVTWIEPRSGQVRAQLPIGTGFESNPQDYVEVGARAFVSRFGKNRAPGREPFDEGDDLLVLDVAEPRIRDRIALPQVEGFPARPGALSLLGGEIVVTLLRISEDFREAGEGMLVGVDPESHDVRWSVTLAGYENCGRAMLSPDGETVAVACSGALDRDGRVEEPDASGLLLLDVGPESLRLREALPALELAGVPVQADVAFASATELLLKTQTPLGGDANNRWLSLDLDTGEVTVLLEARPRADGRGLGVVLGGLWCPEDCGSACLLADADRRVLWRLDLADERIPEEIRIETSVGLPPIGLAPF